MAVFPAGESISIAEGQEAYNYFKNYLYRLTNRYNFCLQPLNKTQEETKTIYQVTLSQSENIKMNII